ncbi:hypothetical protein D9M68_896080 [compost metagenome]
MLAGKAVLHEVGTRTVDVVVELEVFDRRLACAAARAGVHGGFLEGFPVEGQNLDLVLVVRILRFAFDAVDLQKNVL